MSLSPEQVYRQVVSGFNGAATSSLHRLLPPKSLVRKRASGLTEILARALRDRGREVEVEHLHAHLPRVLKKPANGTAHPNPTQEATR